MLNFRTNNHIRELFYGYDLPVKEYNWWLGLVSSNTLDNMLFFRYKGVYYNFSEAIITPKYLQEKGYNGVINLSAFSGLLVKVVDDESVIVTYYWS